MVVMLKRAVAMVVVLKRAIAMVVMLKRVIAMLIKIKGHSSELPLVKCTVNLVFSFF